VLPVVVAVRAGRPLVLLRGILLSMTGSLFLVRSEPALQHAAQAFLTDLHPTLPPALMLAVLVLVWVGTWNTVLPELGDTVARAPSVRGGGWQRALGVLAIYPAVFVVSALAIYFAVFVLGGLPGALAHGLNDQGQRAGLRDRTQAAELTAARAANAVAVCSYAAEALRALKAKRTQSERVQRARAEVIEVGERWAVQVGARATACNPQAEKLTLVQAQELVREVDNVMRRASPGTAQVTPIWTAEPKAVVEVVGLSQMGLKGYFTDAIWNPWAHISRMFADLDLALTFVLLGEVCAAFLWLLDVSLRRRTEGQGAMPDVAPDPDFITHR